MTEPRESMYLAVLAAIPQQHQRQDSVTDQMRDLYLAAVRLGCNDAADWIARRSPFAWVAEPGQEQR